VLSIEIKLPTNASPVLVYFHTSATRNITKTSNAAPMINIPALNESFRQYFELRIFNFHPSQKIISKVN